MHQNAVRKGIIILTTISILGIFIIIMNSGGFLKQSFSENDDVEKYLSQLDRAIVNEQWNKSVLAYNSLYEAWRHVEKRVQYSVERDKLLDINHGMARLKGCIRRESVDDAVISLEEIKSYWHHVGK